MTFSDTDKLLQDHPLTLRVLCPILHDILHNIAFLKDKLNPSPLNTGFLVYLSSLMDPNL